MPTYLRSFFLTIFSLLIVSVATPALSQATFAEHKYVLQLSDMDPSKQELILNVASNLLSAYPPGQVEVEIVTFGPGLRLLFADNVHNKRINSLALSGVKFAACGNTLTGMTKMLGEEPKINPVAKMFPAGVVRIGELSKQGYVYVKP